MHSVLNMTQIVHNYHHLATGFRNIIITLAQGIIASIRGMTISLIIRLLMISDENDGDD